MRPLVISWLLLLCLSLSQSSPLKNWLLNPQSASGNDLKSLLQDYKPSPFKKGQAEVSDVVDEPEDISELERKIIEVYLKLLANTAESDLDVQGALSNEPDTYYTEEQEEEEPDLLQDAITMLGDTVEQASDEDELKNLAVGDENSADNLLRDIRTLANPDINNILDSILSQDNVFGRNRKSENTNVEEVLQKVLFEEAFKQKIDDAIYSRSQRSGLLDSALQDGTLSVGGRSFYDSDPFLGVGFGRGRRSEDLTELLPDELFGRRSRSDELAEILQDNIFGRGRRFYGSDPFEDLFNRNTRADSLDLEQAVQDQIFGRGRRASILFPKMMVSMGGMQQDTCGCDRGCDFMDEVDCVNCCLIYNQAP